METENLNYTVIKNWYFEFKACLKKCEIAHDSNKEYIFSEDYKKAIEIYENLHGALWGLETVNYISIELCAEYTVELITMFDFNKEKRANNYGN